MTNVIRTARKVSERFHARKSCSSCARFIYKSFDISCDVNTFEPDSDDRIREKMFDEFHEVSKNWQWTSEECGFCTGKDIPDIEVNLIRVDEWAATQSMREQLFRKFMELNSLANKLYMIFNNRHFHIYHGDERRLAQVVSCRETHGSLVFEYILVRKDMKGLSEDKGYISLNELFERPWKDWG